MTDEEIAELWKLRSIVIAFASEDPARVSDYDGFSYCPWCGMDRHIEGRAAHDEGCAWLKAREAVGP